MVNLDNLDSLSFKNKDEKDIFSLKNQKGKFTLTQVKAFWGPWSIPEKQTVAAY